MLIGKKLYDMGKSKPKVTRAVEVPPAPTDNETIDVNSFIQSLPEDKRSMAERVIIGIAESKVYQGPIPPPEDFREYEAVLPGASKEILGMAKSQQGHRIEMEKRIVDHEIKSEDRGQLFGFILGVLCIVGALIASYTGNYRLSYFLATTTLLGAIGVFVLRKFPQLFGKKKEANDDLTPTQ